MNQRLKVGVIGLGYWGPNYVRNFTRHECAEVVWGCDLQETALKKIHNLHPKVKLTKNYKVLLNDKALDLIAIATPPETHYKITKEILNKDKHVLVPKPLATKSKDAEELLRLAKRKNLFLHCDMTYLYAGAIRTISYLLKKRVIGRPLYFDSIRTNLGLFQNEVNVIWDLAIHDFSIINYLFPFNPQKIFATGSRHYKKSRFEEIAHITINYSSGFTAHIHVSWLSPIKLRTVLIGGSKKMIYFDDIQPDEKVKIYDKGVTLRKDEITPFKPVYRSGDVIIPKINSEETLFVEINEIVNQILKQKINYKNAEMSIEVIKLLESCDKSLKKEHPINL